MLVGPTGLISSSPSPGLTPLSAVSPWKALKLAAQWYSVSWGPHTSISLTSISLALTNESIINSSLNPHHLWFTNFILYISKTRTWKSLAKGSFGGLGAFRILAPPGPLHSLKQRSAPVLREAVKFSKPLQCPPINKKKLKVTGDMLFSKPVVCFPPAEINPETCALSEAGKCQRVNP